jgi:hypothetical protein
MQESTKLSVFRNWMSGYDHKHHSKVCWQLQLVYRDISIYYLLPYVDTYIIAAQDFIYNFIKGFIFT